MAFNVPLSSLSASDGNVTYSFGTVLTVGNGGNVTASSSLLVDVNGNIGIGTTSTIASGNAVAVYGGNIFVAGNIRVGNTSTQLGGIQFADGSFMSTAASGSGTSITITDDTSTNAPRYVNFTSATSGTATTIYTSSTKLTYYPTNGNLVIGGQLSATTKSFVIDHPTRSGMKLQYGSLEGPENGVYLRGTLHAYDKIMLPEYWSTLVDMSSITVNLTPFGRYQKLYVGKITDEYISIEVDNLLSKPLINCYYTVYAARRDVPKLLVEI